MKLLIIKGASILRIVLIFFIVAAAAVFSILISISNPEGVISFYCLKLSGMLIAFAAGVRIHSEGIENIDKNRVQIIASNHSSHLDAIVIYNILPANVAWMAKKELFRIPFLGCLMKANRFISIDRGDGRKAVESLNQAVEIIKNGTRIAIFPEGTRSIDGELLPFKKLLFKLCLKTGVSIVPVYIEGANKILKPKTFVIFPGEVYVKVGKAIETLNYQPNNTTALMNDFRDSMLQLQRDVRVELNTKKRIEASIAQ